MTGCLFKGIIIQNSHVGNQGGFGRGKWGENLALYFQVKGQSLTSVTLQCQSWPAGLVQCVGTSRFHPFLVSNTSKYPKQSSEVLLMCSVCDDVEVLSTNCLDEGESTEVTDRDMSGCVSVKSSSAFLGSNAGAQEHCCGFLGADLHLFCTAHWYCTVYAPTSAQPMWMACMVIPFPQPPDFA